MENVLGGGATFLTHTL